MARDPRLQITDAVQAVDRTGIYGICCSQFIWDMLELRSAAFAQSEVPIMNTLPVGVDKFLGRLKWETVATKEEWQRRVAK